MVGVAIHLPIPQSSNVLKINNVYGCSCNGLVNFMYDILKRKGLRPTGNRYIQLTRVKRLLSNYTPEQIETAMLKANAVSRNAWGIKFIERLLIDG